VSVRTFDAELTRRLCCAVLVRAGADVLSGVLEVDLVNDETASSAVGHHFDVLRSLHRLVVVQPRYLKHNHARRTFGLIVVTVVLMSLPAGTRIPSCGNVRLQTVSLMCRDSCVKSSEGKISFPE